MILGVAVNTIVVLLCIAVAAWSWKKQSPYSRIVSVVWVALSLGAVAISWYFGTPTWPLDLSSVALLISNVASVRAGAAQHATQPTIKGVAAAVAGFIYLIAVATIPVLWARAYLPPTQWWMAGLAIELLLFGASAALLVWWTAMRPTRAHATNGTFDRLKRAALLVLLLMVPVSVFLVIPSLCFGLLPGDGGTLAGLGSSVLLGVAIVTWWQSRRNLRRYPNNTLVRYAAEHGMLLDRVGESRDDETRAGDNHP